jgi:two-component system sensor histidine kinase KdpD
MGEFADLRADLHTERPADPSGLLACVGPWPEDEQVMRRAADLAVRLNVGWHAVYVETPRLQRLPSGQRERILRTLKSAGDAGAKTAILPGSDIASAIAEYAREHKLSTIVFGRSSHETPPWRAARLQRISRRMPETDLIEIGNTGAALAAVPSRAGAPDALQAGSDTPAAMPRGKQRHRRYAAAAAASLLTAAIATLLVPFLDLANIVMLFLLTVVLVAVKLGRGPAIVSSLVGVAAFDFFFVPPRLSFAITDLQYLVTFAVMLAVSLITGHMTANLRYQARVASHRESRSRALYEYARELSGALQIDDIFEITRSFIQHTFDAQATLLLPDGDRRLHAPSFAGGGAVRPPNLSVLDLGVAQWAFDHATPAGIGSEMVPGSSFFYLPLVAPMRTRGMLVIQPKSRRWILIPEQRQHLDTFAALAAIALERVHYIEVAQDALVHMESERLRNSLLATLSHDLRTPLTSLVGLSESLALSRPPLSSAQHELATAMHEEALRMSNLVANLLEMARIQSGDVKLNLQWQPFEEIVGSSLRASRAQLARHRVRTALAPGLPLVRFDAVLLERVLCNLLENAAKYTPPGSEITIAARVDDQFLNVEVNDNGPGLPTGLEEAMFEKFTRGENESATSGVGLGLAICRAIVNAHGGAIHAGSATDGGASFVFTIPLGTPPAMPDLCDATTAISHD